MSIEPIRDPLDMVGRETKTGHTAVPRPSVVPGTRELRARTLLRLGLRQFAAGMLSVVTLGVLNRVMKNELGVDLAIAAVIVATYNLSSPLAVAVGARSDRHPIRGLVRTPYIIGGAAIAAFATLGAPFAAFAVADGVGAARIAAFVGALGLFVLLGLGMYGAGTAFFALLADRTPAERRGRAAAIVYSMLMAGIMAGVGLTAVVMSSYSRARLIVLFGIVAGLLVILTTIAVWGVERPGDVKPPAARVGWRAIASSPQARRFFAFLSVATFFAFLQQAVLEPFGGDVFDLSVRATTAFNGEQITGVLLGMGVAGRWFSRRWGDTRTTAVGLAITGVAFGVLTVASFGTWLAGVHYGIVLMGFGLGVFNVGGLALMMGMTVRGAVGLAMGVWTLAHAVADGLATAMGGVIHDVAFALAGTEQIAYGSVFAIEAVGLLATIALLRGIDPMAMAGETRAG